MPTMRATARTPPTVVAPTSPATAHAARSRGPTFRALESKRASSSSVSPTRMRPSSDPDRRGRRTGCTDSLFHLDADLDAVRSGKAVRHDRRLERDDRSALVERARGPRPRRWMSSFTPRTVSASRRPAGRSALPPRARGSGPPTIQPAASASPAPVESTTCSTGMRVALVAVERAAARSALEDPDGVDGERPTTRSSSSFAKTTSGARRADRVAERILAAVADRAPGREVDADRALRAARASSTALQRCAADGLDHECVARDVEVVAGEPGGIEVVGTELSRRAAIRGHRALAVGDDERADGPVAAADRADDLDPERGRASRGRARRRHRPPSCRRTARRRRAPPPKPRRSQPVLQARRGCRRRRRHRRRPALRGGRSRRA